MTNMLHSVITLTATREQTLGQMHQAPIRAVFFMCWNAQSLVLYYAEVLRMKKKGKVFIALGLLLIAGALGLT